MFLFWKLVIEPDLNRFVMLSFFSFKVVSKVQTGYRTPCDLSMAIGQCCIARFELEEESILDRMPDLVRFQTSRRSYWNAFITIYGLVGDQPDPTRPDQAYDISPSKHNLGSNYNYQHWNYRAYLYLENWWNWIHTKNTDSFYIRPL